MTLRDEGGEERRNTHKYLTDSFWKSRCGPQLGQDQGDKRVCLRLTFQWHQENRVYKHNVGPERRISGEECLCCCFSRGSEFVSQHPCPAAHNFNVLSFLSFSLLPLFSELNFCMGLCTKAIARSEVVYCLLDLSFLLSWSGARGGNCTSPLRSDLKGVKAEGKVLCQWPVGFDCTGDSPEGAVQVPKWSQSFWKWMRSIKCQSFPSTLEWSCLSYVILITL